MNRPFLSITQAAKYLGVTPQTLRRWHESGVFRATMLSPGGHRWYGVADLALRTKGIAQVAKEWVENVSSYTPNGDFYCQTSDIFRARLERMLHEMQRTESLVNIAPLVASVAGEVGNNSFDHNIGNWPDVPGIFFSYDLGKGILVLADRGRGVLKTLQAVRPLLQTDAESLHVAFTEVVTGRAPENRGNGLKYVSKVVRGYHFPFTFQSGDAMIECDKHQKHLHVRDSERTIQGCLFIMFF